jgi:UDP-N-acetylglucosamine--N-acetylmuramyl-(pentapeptide) pyrophosphoryl-undecaprenol N-acetylglucosamine transferase
VLDASGGASVRVLWLGTPDSLEERIVRGRGLDFRAVTAGPLVGTGPLAFARNALKLARGTRQAWGAMGTDRPDVALVTGGYVSVPVALAAHRRHVPLAVYLPDIRPGQAVRVIARLADRVLVTAEAARRDLPADRVQVTGYPVRSAVRSAERAPARARLGLAPDGLVLLAFGGSQGARHLNRAVTAIAPDVLARAEIVHVAGRRDFADVRAAQATLGPAERSRYHVFEYLDTDDMAAALAAADLAVCRAGAATLGELPARGLPSILVPLPIARGHQHDNAQVLAEAGAALEWPDAELDGPGFGPAVVGLLDSPERRQAMSEAARRLDHPAAAAAIWQALVALAGGSDTPPQGLAA